MTEHHPVWSRRHEALEDSIIYQKRPWLEALIVNEATENGSLPVQCRPLFSPFSDSSFCLFFMEGKSLIDFLKTSEGITKGLAFFCVCVYRI